MEPLNEDALARKRPSPQPACFSLAKPRFLPGARSRRTDLSLEALARSGEAVFGPIKK